MNPILEKACEQAELSATGARLLRAHSNSVYLLPSADLVARIGGGHDAFGRAVRAVDVCRWLAEQQYPAVLPADLAQPLVIDGSPVTFWHYIKGEMPRPDVAVVQLGELLARLHGLPAPDIALPQLDPLARLRAALANDAALPEDARQWLSERTEYLSQAWVDLRSPLGTGLVHGDAQVGNLIREEASAKVWLADWDSVAIGPREWDLISVEVEHRFHGPGHSRDGIRAGYGYDMTEWPKWTIVRDVYELRSIAAHIRRAGEGSQPHLAEALHRVETLRAGDLVARWHAVG